MSSLTEFDSYAANYDAALAQGLAVSGENKEYFARARIAWLAGCLRRRRERPSVAIDFGCGIGSATTFLRDLIGLERIVGVDVSAKSVEEAQRRYGSERVRFLTLAQFHPSQQADLVFCNGVFHHIPIGQRRATAEFVYRSLRPGGLFALWENNPWNPGTRYVMSRIPFDRDALTLAAPETERLLRLGGFEVLQTDFLFIFPRMLRWLRSIEPMLSRLPLGAQYQVLGRKPRPPI